MQLLPILHYPDKRLHLKARPVELIDETIITLVDNMRHTMHHNNGIGLAASQVNVQLRLFIIDLSSTEEEDKLQVFINPQITKRDGDVVGDEGCLSVPNIFEPVHRSATIELQYQDLQGNQQTLECSGLMAVCIQHEIDHLDGKVFVDYLSPLKQNFIKKKMKKLTS